MILIKEDFLATFNAMKLSLGHHLTALLLFKVMMLSLLAYLFYGVIHRPHIDDRVMAANFLSSSRTP